jgi:hypothetical protein
MQQPPIQEAVGSADRRLHLENEKDGVSEGENAFNIPKEWELPECGNSKEKEEQPHAPLRNLFRPCHSTLSFDRF